MSLALSAEPLLQLWKTYDTISSVSAHYSTHPAAITDSSHILNPMHIGILSVSRRGHNHRVSCPVSIVYVPVPPNFTVWENESLSWTLRQHCHAAQYGLSADDVGTYNAVQGENGIKECSNNMQYLLYFKGKHTCKDNALIIVQNNQHDLYLAWLLSKFPWAGSYKQAHISSIIMTQHKLASHSCVK
jgi:hypothetical protein